MTTSEEPVPCVVFSALPDKRYRSLRRRLLRAGVSPDQIFREKENKFLQGREVVEFDYFYPYVIYTELSFSLSRVPYQLLYQAGNLLIQMTDQDPSQLLVVIVFPQSSEFIQFHHRKLVIDVFAEAEARGGGYSKVIEGKVAGFTYLLTFLLSTNENEEEEEDKEEKEE